MSNPEIDKCREVLTEAYDSQDPVTLTELHALALNILEFTTYQRPGLVADIQWHEGCQCHGETHHGRFSDDTIEGMAVKLAGSNHAEKADLDNVYRKVRLSDVEKDELSDRYDFWTGHNTTLKTLWGVAAQALKELSGAKKRLTTARGKLSSLQKDLNDEAIAARNRHIETLVEKVVGCEKALSDANLELQRHRNKTP